MRRIILMTYMLISFFFLGGCINNDQTKVDSAILKPLYVIHEDDTIDDIRHNITLFTMVDDLEIIWRSNLPAVISHDGIITRSHEDSYTVKLTATISFKNAYANKSILFTVTKLDENELLYNSATLSVDTTLTIDEAEYIVVGDIKIHYDNLDLVFNFYDDKNELVAIFYYYERTSYYCIGFINDDSPSIPEELSGYQWNEYSIRLAQIILSNLQIETTGTSNVEGILNLFLEQNYQFEVDFERGIFKVYRLTSIQEALLMITDYKDKSMLQYLDDIFILMLDDYQTLAEVFTEIKATIDPYNLVKMRLYFDLLYQTIPISSINEVLDSYWTLTNDEYLLLLDLLLGDFHDISYVPKESDNKDTIFKAVYFEVTSIYENYTVTEFLDLVYDNLNSQSARDFLVNLLVPINIGESTRDAILDEILSIFKYDVFDIKYGLIINQKIEIESYYIEFTTIKDGITTTNLIEAKISELNTTVVSDIDDIVNISE